MTASSPDGFALIKPGQTYLGKQGIAFGAGAPKETVWREKICMKVMPMPAGAVRHPAGSRVCRKGDVRRLTALQA